MRAIVVFLAFVGCSFMVNASVQQKPSQFVMCKNQKAVRTIRITPDDDGCKTTYSKGGVDEVVEDNSQIGKCKDRLKSLQQNLQASNWTCKQQKAEVTISREVVGSTIR
jgi:hypothetical protein